MKDTIRHFNKLSAQEILEEPDGAFDDYALLDVLAHFDEPDDEDRFMATVELILRSPECSELVNYFELYADLVMYYQFRADYEAAIHWAYAWLVYNEQHEDGADRGETLRSLAQIYKDMGDLDSGLMIYARRAQADPDDLYILEALAVNLTDYGLYELAKAAAKRGLTLKDHADYDEKRQIFEDLLQELPDQEDQEPLKTGEAGAQTVSAIEEALTQPETEGPRAPTDETYLPPVAGLLEAGETLAEALQTNIIAQGKTLAPELVRLAFDRDLAESNAHAHAIALLRAIAPTLEPEFVYLETWLERAEGNWHDELLSHLMGKVGGYTIEELENFATGTQYDASIRHVSLAALTERAQKVPEQRPLVVSFFAKMLERPEAGEASEEEFNAYVILEILDLDARELYPQVKAAFDEDRVEPMTVSLGEVHEEWELEPIQEEPIPKDMLSLYLRCTACGRNRPHTTRYLLIDQGTMDRTEDDLPTRFDPCILDHEVVCPKCGARDRYALTNQANFTIFSPRDPETLLALMSGEMPDKPPQVNPRAYFMRSAAFGRSMHPLEALEEYLWRTAKSPGDADLRLGYATVLRTLFRYGQALEQFRFALELAPNDPETLISNAIAEHDFGDPETARQCYTRILELKMERDHAPDRIELSDISLAAAQGLKALERGEPSAWEVEAYNIDGEALPVPRAAAPIQERPTKEKRKRRRRRRHKGKKKA